jgi:hypothetical protein
MAISNLITGKKPKYNMTDLVNPKISSPNLGNSSPLSSLIKTQPAATTSPIDLGAAYENNLKMKYRSMGVDALKPAEPFKMDLASIQSDPTYQAAMESAKQATQVAEGDISALMNRRGIMDSSVNAQAASNAAQREYGKVNRELLPKLIQDQYMRYMDQNNMNRQYASDLFGVSDMYNNDTQQERDYNLSVSDRTGILKTEEGEAAIQQLLDLKRQAEAPGITREDRSALSKRADNIRMSLQAMGYNPEQFGANVSSSNAAKNVGTAGIKTMAAQLQDTNIANDIRDYERGVIESDREYEYRQARDAIADERYQIEFDEDTRRYGLEFAIEKQIKLGNLAVNQAQENRIAANQSSGGSKSSKSSSKSSGSAPSTDDEEFDPNMPLTMSDMSKYIEGKLPGALQTYGPSNRDDLIERMILSNPNLSDKDIFKLYQKFGIKVPEL